MNPGHKTKFRMLVAVDFSDCCLYALRTAVKFFDCRPLEIALLHVIDERMIHACTQYCVDNESNIKERLFKEAREKLEVLIEEEKLKAFSLHKIICKGLPYKEINRQAEKFESDLVVIGSRGMAGDLDAVFFGGTAERVMRFISRPVFCFPPNVGSRKNTS